MDPASIFLRTATIDEAGDDHHRSPNTLFKSTLGQHALKTHRHQRHQQQQQQQPQQQQKVVQAPAAVVHPQRGVVPEVSTGLIEATTQLRNSVPPLHNFRIFPTRSSLSSARLSIPHSHEKSAFVALETFLHQVQAQRRRKFLAGGRGGSQQQKSAGDDGASVVVPSSLNFVSSGISIVPCDAGFLAALSSEMNSQLYSNVAATTTSSARHNNNLDDDEDDDGSQQLLPHIDSYFAKKTTTQSSILPSCRGERAGRIFSEVSAFESKLGDGKLFSSSNQLRTVETLYLSNNPAIGGLVQPPAGAGTSSLPLLPAALLSSSSSLSSSASLLGLLHFPALKKLSLASCGIRHVAQLAPLRLLPALEHLFLEGNPICSVGGSSASSSAADSSHYRNHVICWFSHCACCCSSGFGVQQQQQQQQAPLLHFRASKLLSLDGRNISSTERQRAVAETSGYLSKLRRLRLLLERSIVVGVVAQQMAVNAEFKHGATSSAAMAQQPVFARHLLPFIVAVRRKGKLHHQSYSAEFRADGERFQRFLASNSNSKTHQQQSHHRLPSDLRSRQKRAARLLLLLSILSERGCFALRSPIFAAAATVFEPCLLCGSPAADSAVTTLVTKTQRRLCVAAARRPRGEQVAARMPAWGDAVRETEQLLEDSVEEGIVLLKSSFFAAPPQKQQGGEEPGLAPLVNAAADGFRNWPNVLSKKTGAGSTTATIPRRIVCGLPITSTVASECSQMMDELLQRGKDVSVFERDANLADLSSMLLLNNSSSNNNNVSHFHHQEDQQQHDDDDAEDDWFLDAPFSEEFDFPVDDDDNNSNNNNRVSHPRPAAELTETESDADLDQFLTAEEMQRQEDQHAELLIVADDFYSSGLQRRCFLSWIGNWYRRFEQQAALTAGFEELRDFERKRALFRRWRASALAQQLEAQRLEESAMRCFYTWRAKCRVVGESRDHEVRQEQRRRELEEQWAVDGAAADEFRRASLLEMQFGKWKERVAGRRAERLLVEFVPESKKLGNAVVFVMEELRQGGGGGADALQRLHLEDTARLALLRLWRLRLDARVTRRADQEDGDQQQQQQHRQQNSMLLTMRRARRQLWRALTRNLVSQRVKQQVLLASAALDEQPRPRPSSSSPQPQLPPPASASASAEVSDDVLALAERQLEESIAEIERSQSQQQQQEDDDSEFLPLERNNVPTPMTRPPRPARRAQAAASCDVSDISLRSGGMSESGEESLARDRTHIAAAAAAARRKQQQHRAGLNLRNLRIVSTFHKLAETMAKQKE